MLPPVEPWLPAERLRREYDAIGFFLSGHPLDDYAIALKRLRVQSWAEFCRAVKSGATAGKVAATVVSRMERRTKTGNKMGIFGLSDPTGHFEAVLFSEGLAQFRDVLEPGAAVLLQLGAELQGEDVRARILQAEPLDDAAAKTQKGLRIFLRDTKPLEFDRKTPAIAGSGGGAGGARGRPAIGRDRGRRRHPGDDARSRNRGGNEAARPFPGLAADRRRDQGGAGGGRRPDRVSRFARDDVCDILIVHIGRDGRCAPISRLTTPMAEAQKLPAGTKRTPWSRRALMIRLKKQANRSAFGIPLARQLAGAGAGVAACSDGRDSRSGRST